MELRDTDTEIAEETAMQTAETDEEELAAESEADECLSVEEEAPAEDIDIRHCQKIIEAVLFAAGYPVSYAKLGQVLGTTAGAAKRIVREYSEVYNSDSDSLPRGIMLLCFDGTCQLCTREQYGTYIREALGIRRGGNLSQSSVETLAVIAYNEPVTRAFVDTVRGVDSSYAMSALLEKQLIEACGRLEVPGRPKLYRTTEDFLRVFGISSLDELPEVAVHTAGIQEKIEIDSEEAASSESDTAEGKTED
ncbi:MAG: SMC-Scp complex subunit ScpB [Candidatus Avispirillum sp.]